MNNRIIKLGHIGLGGEKGWIYSIKGLFPTIPATTYKDPIKFIIKRSKDKMNELDKKQEINTDEYEYYVRKLTPEECWKLMGFQKEDVDKSRRMGMSDSSLYKQAGNSIITNCVELLAEHLYKAQYDENYVCTDENFIQPQQ